MPSRPCNYCAAVFFLNKSQRTPIRPDESIARSTTEIPSQRARMVSEIMSRLCGFDASWRKISASCWERVTDEESLGIVVVEWRGKVFGIEVEEVVAG
nr:hypothetical protein Itr_chr11CG11880 [Ipomoea trifida]